MPPDSLVSVFGVMHTNAMRRWLSLIGGFLWREGSTGLYAGGQLFGTVEASRGPGKLGTAALLFRARGSFLSLASNDSNRLQSP